MNDITVLIIVTFRSPISGAQFDEVERWLSGGAGTRKLQILDNSGDKRFVEEAKCRLRAFEGSVDIGLAAHNLGFSPAVNVCVSRARSLWGDISRWILVNPDVGLDAQQLEKVGETIGGSVGIAAPVLRPGSRDGSIDRGSMRRCWNRRRLFAEVSGMPRVSQLLGSSSRYFHESLVDGSVIDVDITSGAFMAISDAILGPGMSTRLPMYFEDQEICQRAHELGYRVAVDTSIVAVHEGGSSRKLNVASMRWLRVAELAIAPVMSLSAWSGVGAWQGRIVVSAGALVRLVLVVPALLVCAVSPSRRRWCVSQLRLCWWLLSWSFVPSSAGTLSG